MNQANRELSMYRQHVKETQWGRNIFFPTNGAGTVGYLQGKKWTLIHASYCVYKVNPNKSWT